MARIYYNNFIGGLSYSDRMGQEGSYILGAEISPDTYDKDNNYNYLVPDVSFANLSASSGAGTHVSSVVSDLVMAFAPNDTSATNNPPIYGIGDTGKYYKIVSTTFPPYVTANANIWPYQISAGVDGYHGGSGVVGYDLINYKIGENRYQVYSWVNAVSGSIGLFDLGTTFDDDYGALSGSSPGMLSANVAHPMIEGADGVIYIGNGKDLASFDGTTSAWNGSALDLPVGYEITSLFKTNDYLGLGAWKKASQAGFTNSESSIYLWDYISDSFNQTIPIGKSPIVGITNYEGNIYFFTKENSYNYLKRLTQNGSQVVSKIIFNNITNNVNTDTPNNKAVIQYEGKLMFGVNSYGGIYKYGKVGEFDQNKLTLNHVLTPTNSQIGALCNYSSTFVLVSQKNSTDSAYFIKSIYDQTSTNYSTTAVWAGLYTDFGQRVRINYIKYYFKQLSSGDLITPTVSLDYATATGLTDPKGNATISYANDGAIASKRFNVKQDCYTISPRLSFGGGSPKVEKIVIDYDVVEDI